MSIVRAYHAGNLKDIESVIFRGHGIPYSASQGNWLGDGIYFWENDPLRAEHWQIQRNKGAILECEIDTRYLFDLLKMEDFTDLFYTEAKELLKSLKEINRKSSQHFELDRKLFNRIRDKFSSQGKSGIRMVFHLGDSITAGGQHFRESTHTNLPLGFIHYRESTQIYRWPF